MNILHVVRPAEGGMKNHILSLLLHLDKTKYKMILACPQKEEWLPILAGTGVEVVNLPLKGNISLFSDIESVVLLAQLINKKEIHLLHTHGMKAGLVGRLAGGVLHSLMGKWGARKDISRPYILSTVHNSVYQYQIPQYQRHLIGKVQRGLAQQTDRFITVSQALKKEIMQWEEIPEDKIQVIYNGIKTDFFKNKTTTPYDKLRLGLNPLLPVVGTVARLAPQKGVEYFIQAAYLVAQVVDRVQFLIVGGGPLRKDLEKETLKLGLRDKIIFTGQHPDTSRIYPLIDVFVMPSLSEGLSISVIEAMAAKRPILATAIGGIPELIDHRETGILVPPGNKQALAQGILELLKRPKWSEKLAEAAGQKAQNLYTIEKMVHQTEDIYRQVALAREVGDVERRYAHA
ncbi:MAG: glycosyltransferase family 4 protein [Dehalobacterium sp.]